MRIAIDARAISHPQPGGFKTYTTNLVRGLIEFDHDNQYTIFTDRPLPDQSLPVSSNATVEIIDGRPEMWGMPFREQVKLPARLQRGAFDLFHAPCATGPVIAKGPYVATIHDAIEFLEVDRARIRLSVDDMKRVAISSYSRFIQHVIARRAAIIITVSNHSRDDLVHILGINESIVRVIPNAHSPMFSPRPQNEIAEFRRKMRLPPEYILALMSTAPRKNPDGLLRIYKRLPESLRDRFPLVLLSAQTKLQLEIETLIADLGLTPNIQLFHRIPDDELVMLYNAASVFIFPSLYEGFGLPVLEAMACGTPVVASNLTSIPELAADAALLIDPNDHETFAATLRSVLENPERSIVLREAGLKRAEEFSWQRTARMTLDVYQEAVEQFSSEKSS